MSARATPTGSSLPPRLPSSVARNLTAPRVRRRVFIVAVGAAVAAAVVAFAGLFIMREPPLSDHPIVQAGHRLEPVRFGDIPGWQADDPREALATFRRSCAALSTVDRADPLARACAAAAALPETPDSARARDFLEDRFAAYRVTLAEGEGLLTAYYEPVIEGARTPSERFSVPLRALPADHVTIHDGNRPIGFDREFNAARRTASGLEPWPTRGEIDDGALDGIAVPLVWIEDPVDAFFTHIQGSARIALSEGGTMRVGFAGRNGHPYTSVGGVMIERGLRPEGGLSMDGMRAFFRAEPALARELMHENRSYIFFREVDGLDESLGPIGAQGVPLTTQRSLAVDPAFHRFGTPIFIDARLPIGTDRAMRPFQRLMVAQDAGAAIKGPARGDLFWGTGAEAGSVAGGIKAPGTFYVLLPRGG